MIKPEDVRSLTDFQRHTRAHVERLRRTGRPEVLTVNGQAELIVQNALAYQNLLDELQRLRTPDPANSAPPEAGRQWGVT
jgi:hypothetical protein